MIDILYLYYVIGKEGVKVHMEKIIVILDWPSPKNLTKLRGFIRLCTYYIKVCERVLQTILSFEKSNKEWIF